MLELIAADRPPPGRVARLHPPPLAEQFSQQGIRQVELDVYADPKGGLFAAPSARKILLGSGQGTRSRPRRQRSARQARLESAARSRRRFPVDRPHLRRRPEANPRLVAGKPRHVPILILVELKDDAIPGLPTRPVPFGREEIETVDAEILSVFARTEILTPDRVRGRFATLPEAIRAQGWPALNEVRGLVLFALDNEGAATRPLH